MSAEMIGGVAMMGLGLASVGIPIQAAGNLMSQTKRLNRKGREKHLFVQGVPYRITDISFARGISQKERFRHRRDVFPQPEYMMPDLNSVIFKSPKKVSKRRK